MPEVLPVEEEAEFLEAEGNAFSDGLRSVAAVENVVGGHFGDEVNGGGR